IGAARWETLYTCNYKKPEAKDYSKPKEGGGWFRHPSRAKRNVYPYKTDITSNKQVVPLNLFPPKFVKSPICWAQLNCSLFLHRKEKEVQDRADQERRRVLDEQNWQQQKDQVECGHIAHIKPISKKQIPEKYPYTIFHPENVNLDNPYPPTPKPTLVETKPKRVTEDDIRNEVHY
ncbi:unnamed protein product, partial [Sphagnum compactum]